MSVTLETGTTLEFDRFWRWLKDHSNCILRAGTPDCYLYDQESLHWHLDEDAERNPSVQLVAGKQLLAEMLLDVRDVLFVQATPEGEPGQFLFEVVGGPKEDPYALYHFFLAHGIEEEKSPRTHLGALKH